MLLSKNNWARSLKSTSFKIQGCITLIALLIIAAFIDDFFSYIELRPGYQINDLLLKKIPAYNVSVYIFSLVYGVIALSIFLLFPYPILLLKCLQEYCLLTLMRISTIYIFPLETIPSMIEMKDPFIGYFFYKNIYITKDLFFSGHISTMFLLCLVTPGKAWKFLMLTATVITSALLLVQHNHYTIDIIAAPLFSWISYKLANLIPLEIKPTNSFIHE